MPALEEKVKDSWLSAVPPAERVPEEGGDGEGGRWRRLEGTHFPFRFIGPWCLVI